MYFIRDCYEFMYVFVCMYVNFVFFVAEEGQVELQEAVKLWSKRDRELLINNWSKRKRTSSKREEGEESTEERILHRHRRRQQPPPVGEILKALESR